MHYARNVLMGLSIAILLGACQRGGAPRLRPLAEEPAVEQSARAGSFWRRLLLPFRRETGSGATQPVAVPPGVPDGQDREDDLVAPALPVTEPPPAVSEAGDDTQAAGPQTEAQKRQADVAAGDTTPSVGKSGEATGPGQAASSHKDATRKEPSRDLPAETGKREETLSTEKPEKKAETGRAQKQPEYPVTAFVLGYEKPRSDLPALEPLLHVLVTLTKTENGWSGGESETTARTKTEVADLCREGMVTVDADAIRVVSRAIVSEFHRCGLIGVYVGPHPEDIDLRTLKDLRPEGCRDLRMAIYVSTVGQVRTIASGTRIAKAERINHALHGRIRRHSPVQAARSEDGKNDLIQKYALDDFVFGLNRHPRRRVDVAIAPGKEPGQATVDYLVTEDKPWVAFVQATNTGTETTDTWRERVSIAHHQLTNRDDTLNVDYVTAGFGENSQAVALSYSIPLLYPDRLRLRVFGTWHEYTADDVGLAGETFDGDGWGAGIELTGKIYQRRARFIDAVLGLRWATTTVENELSAPPTTSADFFLPHVGILYENTTRKIVTHAGVELEANVPEVADTDGSNLNGLGRIGVDPRWVALKWHADRTLSLDRLEAGSRLAHLFARKGHELELKARGQVVLDGQRLPPQMEQVVGGFFSVRGYEESIAAGDDGLMGSVEYRVRLPEALSLSPRPRNRVWGIPFRSFPQQPGGGTDWGLMLRAFLDAGHVSANQRSNIEADATLVSCGLGLEAQLLKNLSIRCDWGIALKTVDDAFG
ncbi:MAG: hypothetical protein HON70_44370, partial [Lentisphaerae bacterium]|nr:hypothetical protein [Lentisphaerota bacterium]